MSSKITQVQIHSYKRYSGKRPSMLAKHFHFPLLCSNGTSFQGHLWSRKLSISKRWWYLGNGTRKTNS